VVCRVNDHNQYLDIARTVCVQYCFIVWQPFLHQVISYSFVVNNRILFYKNTLKSVVINYEFNYFSTYLFIYERPGWIM
jgi:hypothetical protein